MRLSYDKSLKVAAIGIFPWTRIGLEKWLPEFAMASLYPVDVEIKKPPVVSLIKAGEPHKLLKLNSDALLKDQTFRTKLDTCLAGYDLLSGWPLRPADKLARHRLLTTDPKFYRQFNNKVEVRRRLSKLVNFPPFLIINSQQLTTDRASYDRLTAKFQDMVLQDEKLNGGKATFIVSSYQGFVQAVDKLKALPEKRRIVISKAILPIRNRSLQGAVTKYGLFLGPLQRQLLPEPSLVNPELSSEQFCGGTIISSDQTSPTHHQAIKIAKTIGAQLKSSGYRGVFGVDFVLDKLGQLWVTEVNTRLTGLTPLLTALSNVDSGLPFYLLHLLELGGYDYKVEDDSTKLKQGGSLLIMHSLRASPSQVVKAPASGTYAAKNKLKRVSLNLDMAKLKPGQFIIQRHIPSGSLIKPGSRLISLLLKDEVIDKKTESLYNHINKQLKLIWQQIELKGAASG